MIIKNGLVFTHGGYVKTDLLIGKTIECVKPGLEGENIIDASGLKVLPSPFDIHTHGAVGEEVNETENYDAVRDYMYENGVLNFYATTVSDSSDNLRRICKSLGEKKYLRGINLEGPFLNKGAKGAHNEENIYPADIDLLKELIRLSNGKVKVTTVAPEVGGNLEKIKEIVGLGVKVSVGHTKADYETAKAAFAFGASQITHTFNAMTPIHHRNPGVIPAAAENKNVFFEVIADGLHLHPSIVRMIFNLVGRDRVVLISDSISATGLSNGKYSLGGLDVNVKDGVARTNDGTIAGGTHNLMQIIKSAVSFGIPEIDAIYSATKTPAVAMGETGIGEISVGYDADIILCDEKLNLKTAIKGGEVCTKA
ncbi:MAG: N-acetylglucosamine-6-phosphate deacetylase [Bacillota bacterium]|nr:N-acetylglucosamine-6-phosphate deacetylase [Bacillota bacterium]